MGTMGTSTRIMSRKEKDIDKLVRQIVDLVHPERVILFGSAANGELNEDSDLDILLVMPSGTGCRKTAQYLYASIQGVKTAFDLVVATPELLRRYGDMPGLVYREALRKGTELYAA
jgi:predicted nucleotidyltransferase